MSGVLKKRILFVLGGPGAGKGTQCGKLVKKYGFVHLSAGDLLREERQSGSANGELIDRMIKEGQIVPVKITLALLQQAMIKSGRDLFLIDGFPRNFDNLQGWKEEMAEAEFQVEGVLFFDCPESVMEERLLERGKTSGRTDDNADAIRKRFYTYLESTMPVIEYYQALDKVFKVDATPGPDEVFAATQAFIGPIVNVELTAYVSTATRGKQGRRAAMSFEENMTAFYMAFAERTLEQMCQALINMRLVVQSDRVERHASAPHEQEDAGVREEMLLACELKAQMMQSTALQQLQSACVAMNPDIDVVLTAFFLCTELGAEIDAVVAFEKCLSRVFETQARASFDRVCAFKRTASVNENGYIDRGFYVEAVSEILTGATDIMNAVADVTTNAATLLQVLRPVHAICGEIILEIVHMYEIDARMAAWERKALAQARRQPGDGGEDEVEADESLQMVDLFLDETSFLIRIIMSYSSFLKTICDGLDGERGSSFQVKIQELNGVYLILERFYVVQSVHKATAIAEAQELEPNVFVSSIVEDVSFVLNKSFFRASQCMNYHTALSVVIAIVDALESMYLPSILELPKRDFVMPLSSSGTESHPDGHAADNGGGGGDDENHSKEISFSDMLLQAVDDDLTRSLQDEAKLIMAINSAFMSGEFVESLQLKIEDFSRVSFPYEANIVECLPKHIRELTEVFRSVVDTEIQEILSRGIRKRMKPLVQQLVADKFSYVITSPQYDAFGLQGSPLNKMLEHEVIRNKVLRRYERALCGSPFEALVAYFVEDLTQWLERALLTTRKPFNDLGALQLEREVTDMLTRVSEFVKHTSLRAAFTRLFQVVLVLNLMDPLHIVDYFGSALTEELGVADMETLLRMRVDFKQDAVSKAVGQMRSALAAAKQS